MVKRRKREKRGREKKKGEKKKKEEIRNGSSLPKFLVLMEQVRFSYQFIVSRVS